MKLILLTFLAVLLSCSGSSELSDQNEAVEMQSSGLNDDVFYIIASYSKLTDLLSLAQVNSGFSVIVGSEVRCRYRHHSKLEIIIRGYVGTCYTEDQNQLTIQDAQMALNVLKYFGKYFRTVAFNFNNSIKPSDLKQITQYLNMHCAKSLKQLELDMTQNLLGKFEKTFEAVEELWIRLTTASNETIPLNELFPQLRRLSLRSGFNTVHYDFINSTFPHLEHLHFFTFGDEDVRGIIRRNPTIRSIKPQARHPSLIKFINQQLPNVENLTIYNALYESVRFENVKNLEFMTNDMDSIDKISVPRLESLKIQCSSFNPTHSEKWMKFFKNNTQLRHLFIAGSPLQNSILLHDVDLFTADLPNLTDVTFQIKIGTDIDSIVAFFKNHRKLNSCTFTDVQFGEENQQILREKLEHEWSIKFKRVGGFFQRNHVLLN